MIRKAIPFPLRSGSWDGINSKIVKRVLVDLQQNTQKRTKDKKRPKKGAAYTPFEAKYERRIANNPEVPPDIMAVFAFFPMKVMAVIPQSMRNTP